VARRGGRRRCSSISIKIRARRRGGRAVRVGAERWPDPPPPCLLPAVAHHGRTRRHPCKIHARSACVGRGVAAGCAASSPPIISRLLPSRPQPCHARSADVVPAADQRWRWSRRASSLHSPVVAAPTTVPSRIRRHRARRRSAVMVEPSHLPPTNAAPAVACHHCARSRCRAESTSSLLIIPEPPPPLLLDAKMSPELPRLHSSSPNRCRRSSSLHKEPEAVADP
jgi:hypothetical protein